MNAAIALPFRVYWQPGCTSCLRTKEFLAAHGVPFESINVLQSPTAMAELQAMGLRSVPVLAQGRRFTQAQDIDDVARFVGIDTHRKRLSSQALLARLDSLLALSASIVAVIPEARLGDQIPQRPRSYADIAYHVGMITQGFLDAADERRCDPAMQRLSLTYEHFERKPAVAMQNATALPQWLQQCRVQLADCPKWRLRAMTLLRCKPTTACDRCTPCSSAPRGMWPSTCDNSILLPLRYCI